MSQILPRSSASLQSVSCLQKIADSGLSVDEYLRKHSVPFSRPQYFRYKARLAEEGLDGLRDGRSRGNHRVYRIDVELDQIMAYFRIALVNLSSWFLRHCFGRRPMSLARFLHTILLMPAEIEVLTAESYEYSTT